MSKRIGFIGTGTMGQNAHLKNYAIEKECRVVALCELRQGVAKRVAEKFDIPNVYADHQEMVQKENLDGMVVVQNFGFHGSILPPILGYGIPIITEKPLAQDVSIGQKLLEQAQHNNTPFYVGYHKRSDPATVEAKRWIDQWQASGQFGDMQYVRLSMPPGDWVSEGFADLVSSDEPYPDLANDPKPSDMDEATFDKLNGFVNYYIHQVNLMRHLFGGDYQVTFADHNEHLMATRSDSGITGLLEMQTHNTSLGWQEIAFVCFSHAWVRVELPAPLVTGQPGRVTIYRDPCQADEGQGGYFEPLLPPIHAMRQQARFFIQALNGQATPLCSATDALKDLQIARDYRLLADQD